MTPFISIPRSVIVAADVSDIHACACLANAVRGVPKIGGFKLGLTMGLKGLVAAVESVRFNFKAPTTIICDYQKAGNDIPEMGKKFAHEVKTAGCDGAILFPFAGPVTQLAWTKACQDVGLRVLVGLVMTHEQFLLSEGGYVADNAPERTFRTACAQGVVDFVVPGTKIKWVETLRAILVEELGENGFTLYAPGFVTQGGDISECGKAAGERFHPIVGSAIYNQKTPAAMRLAAIQATSKL